MSISHPMGNGLQVLRLIDQLGYGTVSQDNLLQLSGAMLGLFIKSVGLQTVDCF